jgi:4-amino-4-deoxy-L-arabinose transferase-like glycosyltransferase
MSTETTFSKISRFWQLPLLLALGECLTHFAQLQGDSSSYIDMVKLFRGVATSQEAQVFTWHGMLRPIVPLLAVPISYVLDYGFAIATVDTIFVLLGTFAVYLIGEKMFDPKVAFVSGMSFASAMPVLAYGAAVLTDGAGYGMLAVLTYVALFVLPQRQSFRVAVLIGAIVGVGVLTKETNLLILGLIWVIFLVNRGNLKIAPFLIVTAIAMAISLSWAHVIGQSYLVYYGQGLAYHNATGYSGPLLHPREFLISMESAFEVILPFAILGFFYVDDGNFKKLVEVLVATGSIVLLWPTPPEDRLTFLLFPAIILFAAFGITQASSILGSRPLFKNLSVEAWLTILLISLVVLTNLSGLRVFRLP